MTRSILKLPALPLILILASLAGACGDDSSTNSSTNKERFTLTGKLRFDREEVIPPDAKVMVLWDVWKLESNTPDYWHYFGEGKVNMADSTFSVVFDTPPPALALNRGGIGVGLILLTRDLHLLQGPLEKSQLDLFDEGLIGGVDDQGLVYVRTTADSATDYIPWINGFTQGFTIAQGIRAPEHSLQKDRFVPIAAGEVPILKIDLPKNLDRIRWR